MLQKKTPIVIFTLPATQCKVTQLYVETKELKTIIYLKAIPVNVLVQTVPTLSSAQSANNKDTAHYLSEELWKTGHCLPVCAL